jgi:hypothetical protein
MQRGWAGELAKEVLSVTSLVVEKKNYRFSSCQMVCCMVRCGAEIGSLEFAQRLQQSKKKGVQLHK